MPNMASIGDNIPFTMKEYTEKTSQALAPQQPLKLLKQ